MKLLVTGGAGFIGSNFIHYWLSTHKEDSIINLDALTYAGNLENLSQLVDDSRYQFVKGDICDHELVDELTQQVDLVVHFAAESHVDRSILGPEVFVRTNIHGTFVLLEAAKKYGKRFHHVSTDEVYGSLELGSELQFTEQTPYSPSSPYSASKAGSDHLVRAYYTTYDLPVTISNTSNNFGPYQFPEKLIPLAITNLIEEKKVPIYGDGKQVRDWLYVTDHCRAIDLVIQHGNLGETYLIGGMTEDIPNISIIEKICALLEKDFEASIEYVTDRPGHDVRYSVDWSKARDELGYTPEYGLDEYLEQTVAWYTNNSEWWQRVKSGAYQDYYARQYSV